MTKKPPKKADPTRNARQDRWYASMNVPAQTAAAHRDGFVSRSEALRLWGEGKAIMVRVDEKQNNQTDNKGDIK